LRELLSGWGRNPVTAAHRDNPSNPDEVMALLEAGSPRGVIARGLGRSYGDAAQNAGGSVIGTDRLNQILAIDAQGATATVQAGVSLDQLIRAAVPLGLWPSVTPGTRQVTIGGAIASDVHGKNHHRDGTFCAHVDSFLMATPSRGLLRVGPSSEPDVFWATAGGMGLTGVIVEATLRLTRIETGYLLVDSERLPDIDALMERMSASDAGYRHSVAWIDCLAKGKALGRSILEQGDYASISDLPPRRRHQPLIFRAEPRITAPAVIPAGLLNRMTMTAFNELWFRKAPRRRQQHLVSLAGFFHPLDVVGDWNRIYGPSGFLQYQMVVPEHATEAVRRIVDLLASHRCAGLLAVLKRFGPANPGPLSFPDAGWTLAVDLPIRSWGIGPEELGRLLDRFDHEVVEVGGRVYLSKDSRVDPELLPKMYPRLPEWQAVRDRLDPDRRLGSDLSRRLWNLVSS
jgi:decaprenylphospho-beta-D-ribofuranose 2-oxidase